ncbi:MFS transporter [Pandoraea anhela]|uniref:MFS transporter n=1 Tax=Pandoraea anhela TaxID=2508295 RepID=A0A5E4WHC6_9BURK|nr:MFS transporter [Pandoraea anhela]VVE22466.1 MFS transporter [Pandoraea anhela]
METIRTGAQALAANAAASSAFGLSREAPSPSAAAPTGTAPTIGQLLDALPVGKAHWFAIGIIGVTLFFDMYEIFLVSSIGVALQQTFGISRDTLDFKLLLASAFVGMFFGASVFGSLSDKIGRRNALIFNLTWYSAFSLLGAFSTNATMLVLSRFLTGIGVGAVYPIADSYLSEILPKDRRGRLAAWAYTGSYLAVPFVGFLAFYLNGARVEGVDGWRVMLAIGSLGAVIVLLTKHKLPESPRWLASRGRTSEALRELRRFAAGSQVGLPEHVADSSAGVKALGFGERIALLRRAPYRSRYGMLVVFHLFQAFGYYGFGTLANVVLKSRGYTVTDGTLFMALSFLGYPLGSLLSIPLLKHFERRSLVIFAVMSIAVFGLCFAYAPTNFLIVLFGVATTCASNVFSNAYHVYQAEIFPSEIKSTAVGSTYALSRIVSGALPFLLIPVLVNYGAGVMFGVISLALCIVAITVRWLGPTTMRRSQDELNPR